MPKGKPLTYSRSRQVSRHARKKTKDYVNRRLASLGETKSYFVNTASYVETTNSNTTIKLSGVSAGDAANNRTGDRIDLRYFELRFNLKPDSACTGDDVRVLLWQFKGDDVDINPATSANTDAILFAQDASAFTRLTSPLRQDVKDYKVFYDRVFSIPAIGYLNQGPEQQQKLIRVFRKRLINKVKFNVGANTGINHLYLTVIGGAASGGNASTNLNYSSMLQFKDM